MRISSFESEICLPKGVDLIFPFFADARNLQVLTPPWLEFQMLTKGPILMHSGRLIDYRLRIRGIPLRWRTRIDVWDPPYRFVDSQLKGPYSFWRHEHLFVPERTGTRCIDQVQYAVPGGPWVGRLLVRPDLERMKTLIVPNLQSEGRWARGAIALIFGAIAFVVIPFSRRLGLILFLVAIFTVFEAVRGWCVLRACGIRTQI
jgi:ligand-binding SRPBCC domain-containing protein